MEPNASEQTTRDASKRLPSIRLYLITINLSMLLLFAAISLLFWNQVNSFRESRQMEDVKAMHEAMEARNASLLRSMVLSANQAVAGYDFSTLNTLMYLVAHGDDEIRYCQVLDKSGVVNAHSDPQQVGTKPRGDMDRRAMALMTDTFEGLAEGNATVRFLTDMPSIAGQTELLEAVTPIHSGRELWGMLRCGFSMRRLWEHIETREREWDRQLQQTRDFFVTMVVIFLFLGFAVAVLFAQRLASTVDKLAGGVKRVSEGDLNYQLSLRNLLCTEFNTLAFAFNKMTRNLAASRAQLDEYSRSLEDKVEERTRELEHSNKELEAFNYSVSHDLRAPLRSITGFSRFLIEDHRDQLDETGYDYLKRLRSEAERMGRLIEDMLRLSRLGRQEMHVGMVNLSELAASVLDKLREADPSRSVTGRIQADLQVQGDAPLLGIVLDNLLGNAWKYSSRREHAEIEFGRTEQHGRPVFFVKDNGAGFDMKYADQLFGAFRRLHKSSEFEGTGIGLATVARIIHRHGGSIWAQSEVEKGAVFYFELPD